MLYRKVLSLVLVCAGGISLLNGVSPQVMAAVECDGSQEYEGTICDPAHARHNHVVIGANMSCEDNSSGTDCFPTQESQCGTLEGFQVAARGLCVTTLESSDEFGCEEDTGSTFVPLDYYTSGCQYHEGTCQCMLTLSAIHPTQYSEVCTCSQ